MPYGRLQAGSSWRGGGAAAGAVAALLSVSVLKTGIDWVRIPLPVEVCCYCLQLAGHQSPSEQRCGPDWIPRFVASETPAQPFTEGISLLGIVPIINFAPWSQPAGATENNSSLALFVRWASSHAVA